MNDYLLAKLKFVRTASRHLTYQQFCDRYPDGKVLLEALAGEKWIRFSKFNAYGERSPDSPIQISDQGNLVLNSYRWIMLRNTFDRIFVPVLIGVCSYIASKYIDMLLF